jgi:hypothetical protein
LGLVDTFRSEGDTRDPHRPGTERRLDLPPPLLTSEPGSFAEYTFKVRIPRIVDETIQLNAFPQQIEEALRDLREEIAGGAIRPLLEKAPDRRRWDILSHPFVGRRWLDVPWYWAEAFFYRRLLEATRYSQPGPLQGIDPFEPKKNSELAPGAAPRDIAEILQTLSADPKSRFTVLLHASLWGNRRDLSHDVSAAPNRVESTETERGNLLVDDTDRVWRHLVRRPPGSVAIIADNAGGELLADLALADFLLESMLATRVILHVKAHPFFVSDAILRDVEAGIMALMTAGGRTMELGHRLQEYRHQARLKIHTHWFYTSSLCYPELPRGLHRELNPTVLAILKGDANYRRLLSDAHWSPTAHFSQATAYFPAPLVTLRTLKSEVIAGLAPGMAERMAAQDSQWLVNGRRGTIQVNLPG